MPTDRINGPTSRKNIQTLSKLFKQCKKYYERYCKGLNNRGGQKGGLRLITYIHGRNSRGGQNLWQTQAEHANLIDHQRPFLVYFIGMFSLGLPEVLPPTAIAAMDIRNRT